LITVYAKGKGTFLALKTTRNFWVVLRFRNPEEKKKITFHNGYTMNLNLGEYVAIRNTLSKGYSLEHANGLLHVQKGKIQLVGPIWLLTSVLSEGIDKIYVVDCKDKVVLDVGGFIGDTAVFFGAWGARKVIIYEPVLDHHRFIDLNVKLNHVNAEIHQEGIGDDDGYETIHYDIINAGFGLSNKGTKKIKIKIRNVRKVIEESGADIAKFDCEGAECSLVRVPSEVLRKVGFYMIEIHSLQTRSALLDKFRTSGFILIQEIPNKSYKEVSTVFLKREND